ALDQQAVAAVVGLRTELVEEDVVRDLQRLAQRERPVLRALRVVEDDAADLELARVEERRVGSDKATLERGRRRDQLEGRAGRVEALGRAVGERVARLVEQGIEDRLLDALGEDVRVERRVAAQA